MEQRPDELDLVNHPAHYNSHPSGVETVDVNEWFSGNVAAAIKYVWRRDHKEPVPLRDLQKAEWYLERELRRLGGDFYATFLLPMSPATGEQFQARIMRVYRHEPEGGVLGGVLMALWRTEGDSLAACVESALSVVRFAIAAAAQERLR